MSTKQLILLFICNFIPACIGTGFLTLLPVHLDRLGADPATTGNYLAVAFAALAVSTIIAGRLSDWLQRRKELLILGGLLGVPCAWFMSEATSINQLMILMALLWFAGGLIATTVYILAGLFAEEHERGRVFGILGLCIPVASVLTGLTSGAIVDRWGFQALFVAAALLYIGVPVLGLFVTDVKVAPIMNEKAPSSLSIMLRARPFVLLCFASIIAHIVNSAIILGRPLIMDGFNFDATAIASAGAAGGLVATPLPLLIGWLSDRFGRKPFLVLSYLMLIASLIALIAASQLWHFWTSSALQTQLSATLVVGSALMTDLFPKQILGAPLAWFNASPWIGFVIGFSSAGAAINSIGMMPTLIGGIVLILIAIVLVIPIQRRQPQYQVEAA
jgi:MFS family permease